MTTPAISEDYWLFRVTLSDKQGIVVFPKFLTYGIGLLKEKDWNTNLPFSKRAEEIYSHISHNKGDNRIKRNVCIKAIKLLQNAIENLLDNIN